MNIKNINARTIGLVFASTLLIPSNYGLNILGLNFEDLPLVFLFLFLFYKKINNYDHISNVDKVFLSFIFSFILYSNIFTQNSEIFNQTNLRFYFYFIFSYFCVDIIRENKENLIAVFEPLSYVMIANFLVVLFQVQLPGTIDGWILNNSGSTNPFTSGRLGGFQGGGPNVIGVICTMYVLLCVYKASSSDNILKYLFSDKLNTALLIISIFNLYITYSRGSYLALYAGLLLLLIYTKSLTAKFKIYFLIISILFSVIIIFIFPSIFLKQSNRSFLNNLAISNLELFEGSGGGHYIKEVYKDYLLGLEKDEILEKFNIVYSENDTKNHTKKATQNEIDPAEGYLKLKFDYKDGVLPRSVVSFYHSKNGITWSQIGSEHTDGSVIELIKNDSFFEVGGWGDGQSPGDSYLDGFIKQVNISFSDNRYSYQFIEENRDKDYFVYLPTTKEFYDNRNDGKLVYTEDGLKLKRPRSYWVAIPHEDNISQKDFEVVIQLKLNNIPKGNETIFSQSSIINTSETINNQSWKWSIIDGRMYFFWVEDIISGYSNYLGGQSLRSGRLVTNNGQFDSIISDFSLSQYDEITTSHNGFLTMAVEYGLFPVLIIVLGILFTVIKNTNYKNHFLISVLVALLAQNLTNDLIYSPDVAIYFWIIPSYLFLKKIKN
ncbi:O-antigen ligase family protein [Acidimicrobiia bacterium]|nr:O-antigen ligase family protein [Acidimicrobiia bacterium]MDC3404450.1 O-antigen ligase family protein [Acidimicrobiia bacterium]